MAHPQETREKLRRLYVVEQQSLENAALMCGISAATARKWKYADREKGEDWDKQRTAYMMAGGGMEDVSRAILAGFLVQYQSTIEGLQADEAMPPAAKVESLTSLADAFNKTVSASRKVLPETNELATGMKVLMALGDYIGEHHPQHTAAFVDILDGFAAKLPEKLKG
ncbi:DUF1804 family protein [Conchiformibius steedae DSM 2580]|uniref:DUF1804 family protein n=1 Tax=Conchiformibius steedae DSM 2580 TaxID=1121352 RepID=A0AAE9HXD9_9NEIS|nr:DUF1804 family protein [Conchiformibius steedae]QMT33462.1 DUF1804 family protein [Conchiformibius steedae]URD68117.1 DUF1804 family protein [Conchiformibius steedae DSM 2580]